MKPEVKHHTVNAWQLQDAFLELYRYAPGPAESLTKHCHDDYQFCLSLDFPGEYYYRGIYYSVPMSSLSVIHPGEMHSARDVCDRETTATFWMMYAAPALLQNAAVELGAKPTSLPFFPTPIILDSELARLCLQMCTAVKEAASQLEQDSLLLSVLTQFIQRYADTRCALRSLESEHQRVKQVREYLDAHFTENVNLNQLTQIAQLSPYHLNRVFCQHVGLPPHQYQAQLRVSKAKALLLKGIPIKQVAVETGFADQSHLTRQFKRFTQVTPGRYLLQNRKNVQDKAS